MADPIQFKVQRDVKEELHRKVEDAPAQHAEAVLAAYELLQEAHDHGVLDALRGAIGAGEAFIGTAAGYANTPEGIRAMRNLLIMVRLLGDIDPAVLHALSSAYAQSQRAEESQASEPPSLWQTFRRLTGKDSRRTLAMLAGFTEAFGRAQKSRLK